MSLIWSNASVLNIICFILIISSLIASISGLYLSVGSSKRCFILEQPRDTPITFAYEILDLSHKVGFDLFYGGRADESVQITHKVFVEAVGEFEYVTDNNGKYTYCLQQTQQEDSPTRFKININYGFDPDYYEKLSKEKKYDPTNIELHRVNDMLSLAINEADYQKHKEVEYHAQTEEMNNAVIWWPMLQIGILVVAGVLQVSYLKSFFKSKKLI